MPSIRPSSFANDFSSAANSRSILSILHIYYIESNDIQKTIDEIYCIFYIFTSENIKFYIFTPLFGLPLTFPLPNCSALQNFKRL